MSLEKVKNTIDAKVITIAALITILITQFINQRRIEKMLKENFIKGDNKIDAILADRNLNPILRKLYEDQQAQHEKQINKARLATASALNEIREDLDKVRTGDLRITSKQPQAAEECVTIEAILQSASQKNKTALRETLEQVSTGLLKIKIPDGVEEKQVEQKTVEEIIENAKKFVQTTPRRQSVP